MGRIVSATDANRCFSVLLRRVCEEGQSFTVTSQGEHVARLLPCTPADAGRLAARHALLRRLADQPAIDARPWTREELYDRRMRIALDTNLLAGAARADCRLLLTEDMPHGFIRRGVTRRNPLAAES
jgi:prevent-host-death family protein